MTSNVKYCNDKQGHFGSYNLPPPPSKMIVNLFFIIMVLAQIINFLNSCWWLECSWKPSSPPRDEIVMV